MGCMEVAVAPDVNPQVKDNSMVPSMPAPSNDKDVEMGDATGSSSAPKDVPTTHVTASELLFRCLTCKRLAHYAHLPVPPHLSSSEVSLPECAAYYQTDKAWLCKDCSSFQYGLDKILAWRPYPPNATEPPRPADEPPHYKDALPREYLVKWVDRSFR